MSCSAQDILDAACQSNIAALTPRQSMIAFAQLLCEAMPDCDAETLLESACVSGIAKLSDRQLLVAIAELLCESSGPVTGSDQIKTYVTDPNGEGIVPDDQTKGAMAYPTIAGAGMIYYWNTFTLVWE